MKLIFVTLFLSFLGMASCVSGLEKLMKGSLNDYQVRGYGADLSSVLEKGRPELGLFKWLDNDGGLEFKYLDPLKDFDEILENPYDSVVHSILVRENKGNRNFYPYFSFFVSPKDSKSKALDNKGVFFRKLRAQTRQIKDSKAKSEASMMMNDLRTKFNSPRYRNLPRYKKLKFFTREELRALYGLDGDIHRYFKEEALEIISTRPKKKDLSFALGLDESEISVDWIGFSTPGIKFHYGDLEFFGTELKGRYFPETVFGNFNGSELTNLQGGSLPKKVYGNADLSSLESVQADGLPDFVRGSINLDNINSSVGLNFSKKKWNHVSLKGLRDGDDLSFGENILGASFSDITLSRPLYLSSKMTSLDIDSIQNAYFLKFERIFSGSIRIGDSPNLHEVLWPEILGGGLKLEVQEVHGFKKLPRLVGESLDFSMARSIKDSYLPEVVMERAILSQSRVFLNNRVPKLIGYDFHMPLVESLDTKFSETLALKIEIPSSYEVLGVELMGSLE